MWPTVSKTISAASRGVKKLDSTGLNGQMTHRICLIKCAGLRKDRQITGHIKILRFTEEKRMKAENAFWTLRRLLRSTI